MDEKNGWVLMSSIPFSPTPENKFQGVRKHISCIVCGSQKKNPYPSQNGLFQEGGGNLYT